MLKNQEKRLVFNVSIISLVVSLLVCIPWGIGKVSGFEIVMKYIIIPAFIVVASIINLSIKYRNYRPANKFATIASYVPMFSYASASLFNALMYLIRSNDVYGRTKWVLLTVIIAVVLVLFTVLSHFYYRAVIVFSKNTSMLFDYSFLAITVIDTIALSFIARDHSAVLLEAASVWHIILPALLGALVVVFLAFVLRNYRDYNDEYKLVDKGPLLENWMKIREDLYYNATEEIMNALYIYSADHLEFEDEEEETEQETVVETKIVEVPADTSELEAKLAKAEQEKQDALDKAAKAEQEKEAKLAKAEQEKQEALDKAAKAEQEKEAALAKVAELEKEANKEPEVIKDPELEAEVAKLQGEKAQHEEEKARLQEEIAKRDEQDRLEAEQMAKLQEENAQHEEEKAKLQEENAQHEEEKARLQEEIAKRDEQDRLEAEERAAAEEAKQKAAAEKEAENAAKYKALRPTYDKMCQYIDALEGVRNVSSTNGNKFYIGKKLVAIFQKGKADYRITFQAPDAKFLEYIKDHSDCVSRASSPKGSNWLKLINKGILEDAFVKEILKGAVEYVNAEIQAELAAKEEAKRLKAEEKKKAREAAKAAKKAEKENKAA